MNRSWFRHVFCCVLPALCCLAAPAQELIENNLFQAPVGANAAVHLGDKGGIVHEYAVLVPQAPGEDLHWSVRMHPGPMWPPWLQFRQARDSNSLAALRGYPMLFVTLEPSRLQLLTDSHLAPQNTRHIFAQGDIHVAQHSPVSLKCDVYLDWFLNVYPGRELRLPRLQAPGDTQTLNVKLGAVPGGVDLEEGGFLQRWPQWANLRLRGAEDLVVLQPGASRLAGAQYLLRYGRAPQINERTRIDRPVTLEVVVNETLPTWRGLVLVSHTFDKVVDPENIAGKIIPPTDTPPPGYIITPTYTWSLTPLPTQTFTPAPPSETLSPTPTPSGPTPTLAAMAQRGAPRVVYNNAPLAPGEAVPLAAEDGAEVMLELELPHPVHTDEPPLVVEGAPEWLARPILRFDGNPATRGRLLLVAHVEPRTLAGIPLGQRMARATLTLRPTSPAVRLLPVRLSLQLGELSWRLLVDPPVIPFNELEGNTAEVTVNLSCNRLHIPLPENAQVELEANAGDDWLLEAVHVNIERTSLISAVATVQLLPDKWPPANRTGLLYAQLQYPGGKLLRQPFSVRYEPALSGGGNRWLPLALAVGGGALGLVLIVVAVLSLRRGRREEAEAAEVAAAAHQALADFEAQQAVANENPFDDLPPEAEEDDLSFEISADLFATGTTAPAPPPGVTHALSPEELQSEAEPAAEPVPAPAEPERGETTLPLDDNPLLAAIWQALQEFDFSEGDPTVKPSTADLETIAQQLLQQLQPVTDRLDQLERKLHDTAAPAGAPAELDKTRQDVAQLGENIEQLKERLDTLEEMMAFQAKTMADQLDQLRDNALAPIQEELKALKEKLG